MGTRELMLREEPAGSPRLSLQTRLFLVLLTLGAALLRFSHLDTKSFSPDEAFSIAIAHSRWSPFLQLLTTSQANMALYYLLLRLWIHISDAPAFVRALSVIFGVVSVPVLYCLGKTLFSSRTGIIAALLLAVSVSNIFHSQEARSYSLLVLLVSCSSLFFVRGIKSGGGANSLWYILISTATLYTHFFAALVLLAQFVAWTLLPSRFRDRSHLRNTLAVATLGLPAALFVVFSGTSHLDWIQRSPNLTKELYHLLMYLSGSGVKFAVFLLATALASREWWVQRQHTEERTSAWSFDFIACWLVIPIAITLLVSVWKPILVYRFLIICLPPALLLFAQGLALIRPSWLYFATLTLVVGGSLVGVKSFYRQPPASDWRAAITYLAQNALPGDVLVFANPYCRFPFEYNLRTSTRRLPEVQVRYADPGSITDFPVRAHHVWVIDFSAQAHPHWMMLPTNGQDQLGELRFYFQETSRFPGVEIEQFKRSAAPDAPPNH
jgi:mannosyltransferase